MTNPFRGVKSACKNEYKYHLYEVLLYKIKVIYNSFIPMEWWPCKMVEKK